MPDQTVEDETELTAQRVEIGRKLTGYVRSRLLAGADADELTGTTPLLESGVLNSIGTARLIAFMRDEFGVRVPPNKLTGAYFRDLDSITDLVVGLQADRRSP